MATEIERKFLVVDDAWRRGVSGQRLNQGYLTKDPERAVRVRIGDDRAFLTIKGKGSGIARPEFEYAIPVEDARQILESLCLTRIDKTRYRVAHGRHTWEVDEFHGDNAGLVVAEIELAREDESFELPPWAGAEVTADPRYANQRLAELPFSRW